jgi:hypothetical protein
MIFIFSVLSSSVQETALDWNKGAERRYLSVRPAVQEALFMASDISRMMEGYQIMIHIFHLTNKSTAERFSSSICGRSSLSLLFGSL